MRGASRLLDLPPELRATLRHLEAADAPGLLAAVEQERERLERWLTWPVAVVDAASAGHLIEMFRRQADRRAAGLGLFVEDQLAGGCNLVDWNPAHATVELGVWATTATEGRGLMRTASAAAIRYARGSLRAERVEWRAAVENDRSRALAKRLGFVEEGTARSAEVHSGHRIDLVRYSLVQSELDAV